MVTPVFPKTSETFILDQVTALLARGVEVDVIAECADGDSAVHAEARRRDVQAGVHYAGVVPKSRVGRAAKALPYAIRALVRRETGERGLRRFVTAIADARMAVWTGPGDLARRDYDVIHCHFGPSGLRGLALRNIGILDGPVVTTFHGYGISRVIREDGRQTYRRLFQQGDLALTVSRYFRDRLLELGCPEDRVHVHHMGVDTSRFSFKPRMPPADGPVRLLSVARLTEKKGIEYALRALDSLDPRATEVRYEIVGDGPLRQDLERLAADLGLQEVVEFRGSQPREEVLRSLYNAHLFLAPSVTASDGDQEGIPVAIMEAMATGLPVLTTRHSGIPELVDDGVSGYMVPERDAEALGERLACLLQHPDPWEEMGRAGRRRVEEEFDQNRLFDELIGVYEDLV